MSETTRGRLEIKIDDHGKIVERNHLASHPANPVVHLGNSKRDPEPVQDLLSRPDLTGKYVEFDGRYRLFVNHAGPRIEMLLTLVTQDWLYGTKPASPANEVRVPKNWVQIDQTKQHVSGRSCRPLAYRLSGTHIAGGLYALEIPFWADDIPDDFPVEKLSVGTLSCGAPGSVELRLGPEFLQHWPFYNDLELSRATQVSTEPVLLEGYLDHASVPFDVRTLEWFDPTPQQRRRIEDTVGKFIYLPIEINQHLLPASGGENGTRLLDLQGLLDEEIQLERLGHLHALKRRNVLISIDVLVEKIVSGMRDGGVENGAVGPEHLEQIRGPVLYVLDEWTFVSSNPAIDTGRRSVLSILLRALDRNSQGQSYPALERYLGLRGRGWRKHRYSIDLEVYDSSSEKAMSEFKKEIDQIIEIAKRAKNIAVQIGAQVVQKIRKSPTKKLLGTLRVRYEGVTERYDDGRIRSLVTEEPWEAHYWVMLGGAGLKKAVGKGFKNQWKATAETWSNDTPLPEDLEGTVSLLEFQLYVGAKTDPAPGGTEGDFMVGGQKNVLQIWGKEHGLQFILSGGQISKPGAGAGASAMVLNGSIELLDSSVGKVVLPDPVPVLPTSYWENAIPSLALHFEVNGAKFIRPTAAEEEKIRKEKRLITRDALAAFAAYELPILSHPLAKLEITGHADMPDTRQRNKELSANRAQSVYNLLQSFLGSRLLAGRTEDEALAQKILTLRGPGEEEAAKEKGASEDKHDPRFRRADLEVYLGPMQKDGEDILALIWHLRRDENLSLK